MSTSNPLPKLSGHITHLHIDTFTLWVEVDMKSKAYVKKRFAGDNGTGTIQLCPSEWAQMLRYLSTGQSAVDFDLVDVLHEKAAPLKMKNVVGRDAGRPYWTVSGEVEICPEFSDCESDDVGEEI